MAKQNFREKPELEQEWKAANMMGHISLPEEYNGTVLYLLSDASTFMTGSAVTVDGGYTAWRALLHERNEDTDERRHICTDDLYLSERSHSFA